MPPANRTPSLGLMLAAVAVVAAGYGVILPSLPELLRQVEVNSGPLYAHWHAGLMTGLYSAAVVIFAPIWGWLEDTQKLPSLLPACLLGFGGSLLLSLLPSTVLLLYVERFLSGAFAAGVVPIVSARIASGPAPEMGRSRGFAGVGMATIAGFLLGPMISGWVVPQVQTGSIKVSPSSFVSFLAFAIAVAIAVSPATSNDARSNDSDRRPSPEVRNGPRLIAKLRGIAFLTAASVSIFEIAIALRGGTSSADKAPEVALLLAACAISMLIAQGVVFSWLSDTRTTAYLVAPALVIMSGTLIVLPNASSLVGQLATVVLFALSSGMLFPTLSYWISVTGYSQRGSQFGKQASLINMGQTLGSVVGGMTYDTWLGPVPITAASVALIGAALIASRTRHSLSSSIPAHWA